MPQLHEDLKKMALKQKIETGIESGLQCGITMPPAVFLNEKRHVGPLEYNALAKELKHVLSQQRLHTSYPLRITAAPQLSKLRPQRNTTGTSETVKMIKHENW